jgi:hypothetical protein
MDEPKNMLARIKSVLARRRGVPMPWSWLSHAVADTQCAHVCIGSSRDAANPQRLWDLGITHVLNAGGAAARGVTVARDGASGRERPLTVLVLEARDAADEPILAKFYAAAEAFLDTAVGGRALVHCFAGVNRSVTLACAYVAARSGQPVDAVVARVLATRFSALTNAAFVKQLAEFDGGGGVTARCSDRAAAARGREGRAAARLLTKVVLIAIVVVVGSAVLGRRCAQLRDGGDDRDGTAGAAGAGDAAATPRASARALAVSATPR